MTLAGVKTPQFRTLLLRRLKNMFLDCSARIEDAPLGITFQLSTVLGSLRRAGSTFRAHASALTKRTLTQKVRLAHKPVEKRKSDDGI